jgi:hypothetical protein
MTYNTRRHPGHECPPPPEHPAEQPKPPHCGEECAPLPESKPPDLKKPDPCPEPDECCGCPSKPDTPPTCLEDLIAGQEADLDAVANSTNYKNELAALLEKAKTARQLFTRDTYDDLVEEWVRQDIAIAELVRQLVCNVPCWKCVLDCHVCPLLNELHYAEKWLFDDGKLYTEVHDLYDLRYWLQRDRDAKVRTFNRIKGILGAWETPVKTIAEALKTNQGLYDVAKGVLGPEPGKAIYDVFLRLVPLHLAIAPPAHKTTATPPDCKEIDTTTRIDREFTNFCTCDDRKPEWCCGINVAERSLRARLTGPQPYLIDPNQYFDLICCLVKNRYGPARLASNKAEADLKVVETRVANFEKQLKDWPKDFEKNAKGAIPSVINCCDYEPKEETQQS